jgi:hypothetical protein
VQVRFTTGRLDSLVAVTISGSDGSDLKSMLASGHMQVGVDGGRRGGAACNG